MFQSNLTLLVALLLLLSTVASLLGVLALLRVRRKRAVVSRELEPVTVLKPLCGVDDGLEENLRSFFVQDHPDYELIFGVEGTRDPAIAVFFRLAKEFPKVRAHLVVHDGGLGINPKMSNLRAMLSSVTHDLLLISDSNVRVPPSYVSEMARTMQDPGVGLVTNLFAGVGEKSVGALLENLHLNSIVASSVATANELLHQPAVVGKSMMFHRSELETLGGFSSVADVLAEDYVIGRMFHEAGKRVVLASTVVENVVRKVSVKSFFMRQLRWGMIRVRMVPLVFFLEPLSSPLLVALIASALGAPLLAMMIWALAVTLARDAATWTMLRGTKGFFHVMPLLFLRDVLVLAAWSVAIFARHVRWRGKRVRVSAGTRLYAEHVFH